MIFFFYLKLCFQRKSCKISKTLFKTETQNSKKIQQNAKLMINLETNDMINS